MLTCAALRETSCWGGGGEEGEAGGEGVDPIAGLRVDGYVMEGDGGSREAVDTALVIEDTAMRIDSVKALDTPMSISSSSCDSVEVIH